MALKLRKSAAREGRAFLFVIALGAAYLAGSAKTNCWQSLFHHVEVSK